MLSQLLSRHLMEFHLRNKNTVQKISFFQRINHDLQDKYVKKVLKKSIEKIKSGQKLQNIIDEKIIFRLGIEISFYFIGNKKNVIFKK